MKRNKIFCIDEELFNFLKGKNASELVNKLLNEQIEKERFDGYNKEQCQTELDIIKLKKEMDNKIKEMRKNVGL